MDKKRTIKRRIPERFRIPRESQGDLKEREKKMGLIQQSYHKVHIRTYIITKCFKYNFALEYVRLAFFLSIIMF